MRYNGQPSDGEGQSCLNLKTENSLIYYTNCFGVLSHWLIESIISVPTSLSRVDVRKVQSAHGKVDIFSGELGFSQPQ